MVNDQEDSFAYIPMAIVQLLFCVEKIKIEASEEE